MLMKILRKFLVFIAATGLSGLLFLLVATSTFSLRFGSSDGIKKWLQDSGAYENFTAALLEQSALNAEAENTIPVDDPRLVVGAREAFNAPVLRGATESIVDGVYGWLRGETAEPRFQVDLREAKSAFAKSAGEFAADRYETLPKCGLDELPTSVDPFQDTCSVSTLDRERIIKTVSDEINSNEALLGNGVYTAQSFTSASNDSQTVFESLSNAPKIFRLLLWLPLLIGALCLLCITIIVFCSENRRKGLRRVAVTLILTGCFVLFGSFAASLAMREFDSRLSSLLGAGGPMATQVVNPLVETISQDTRMIAISFALGYILLAVAALITLFIKRDRLRNVAPPASKTPPSRQVESPEESPSRTPPTSRSNQPVPAMRDSRVPRPLQTAPELPSEQPTPGRLRPDRPMAPSRPVNRNRNLIQ